MGRETEKEREVRIATVSKSNFLSFSALKKNDKNNDNVS